MSKLLLCVFLVLPFLSAIVNTIFETVRKNIEHSKIADVSFIMLFVFSLYFILTNNDIQFQFLNFNFNFNNTNFIFIFVCNFIFLLFSLISRNLILKSHKLFYGVILLLCGLVNIILINDNILIDYLCLFWIFLLNYLLYSNFSKEKSSKELSYYLGLDIFTVLVSFSFVGYGLLRYFVVNDISFSFNQIAFYYDNISELSFQFAFWGLIIIIFRLFHFLPFLSYPFRYSDKDNSLILSLNVLIFLLLGSFLLEKTYIAFNVQFIQDFKILAIYFIVNILYFSFLFFGQKNFIKALISIIPLSLFSGIFILFSNEYSMLASCIVYFIAVMLSFSFAIFVFLIIEDKLNTNRFEFLEKIKNDIVLKYSVVLSLIITAKVPPFILFSSLIICLLSLFSLTLNNLVMKISVFFIIFSILIVVFACIDLIYKILIKPELKIKQISKISKMQFFVLFLIFLFILLFSLCPNFIFEQLLYISVLGN